MQDRFTAYHPIINFSFFIGAFVFGMILMHPAFLICSLILSVLYYLTVRGRNGLKYIAGMWSVLAVISLLNPVFNTRGETVIFTYLGERKYTVEALLYGVALAAMMVSILMWFASYNSVMTSDKFLFLFGRCAPSVTLILTMVLRLVPSYKNKVIQMNGARRCIGKGAENGTKKERIHHGVILLSALTSWALEGGVITADSMRCRGYGCGRRTNFSVYRFEKKDKRMLTGMIFLTGMICICYLKGGAFAEYTPHFQISEIRNPYTAVGIAAYAVFLAIPSAVNIGEEMKWRSLKSRI